MKLLRITTVAAGLLLLLAFPSEAHATQLAPQTCEALAYAAMSFAKDYQEKVPRNKWMRDFDMDKFNKAPKDVQELVNLIQEVIIQAGPDVPPEVHGQGFFNYCMSENGDAEKMDAYLKQWLLEQRKLKEAR